jgi:hypothetical protein
MAHNLDHGFTNLASHDNRFNTYEHEGRDIGQTHLDGYVEFGNLTLFLSRDTPPDGRGQGSRSKKERTAKLHSEVAAIVFNERVNTRKFFLESSGISFGKKRIRKREESGSFSSRRKKHFSTGLSGIDCDYYYVSHVPIFLQQVRHFEKRRFQEREE